MNPDMNARTDGLLSYLHYLCERKGVNINVKLMIFTNSQSKISKDDYLMKRSTIILSSSDIIIQYSVPALLEVSSITVSQFK